MKTMLSTFYLTRLSWNRTEEVDGELQSYRTYIVGGSLVGYPMMIYGRTPHIALGGTALAPHNADIFVE
jgi:acyl-homoserine lactone acylase PvdQ